MKHTVFYSWQADLDSALTRNIIEECLNKAAASIRNDESTSVDPVVDRDTVGASGASSIADVIFRKISSCDVFVADVSFINGLNRESRVSKHSIRHRIGRYLFGGPESNVRLTPNPNVLTELGFAAARIGWEKIVLVMNTHFGPVEDLPFDLRGRRVIPFHLSSREHRSALRPKLKEDLGRALRDIIRPTSWSGLSAPRWFGLWEMSDNPMRYQCIFIREVGAEGFTFDMELADGARTGSLRGFARFTGPNSAFATIGDPSSPCEIKFNREGRTINIVQGSECRSYMGMGAHFDGRYVSHQDHLFDSGALTEIELQRLYGITGQYYINLMDCFQRVGSFQNEDPMIAESFVGGVKGLYTIIEAIVMKSESGHLWAAFIDGDVVRYFTNHSEYKNKMPKTIERWRERFSDMKVVYGESLKILPEHI